MLKSKCRAVTVAIVVLAFASSLVSASILSGIDEFYKHASIFSTPNGADPLIKAQTDLVQELAKRIHRP